jgi:hypothetical protein
MLFKITSKDTVVPNNSLVYRSDEYSFDVEPPMSGGSTSILINDLNLEIDYTGKLLFIWGLCPYLKWVKTELVQPKFTGGEIVFVPDDPPKKGVSIRLFEQKSVFVDKKSGWVYIPLNDCENTSSITIIQGVVIDIGVNGDLSAIWLRPNKLPLLID